MTTTEEKFNTAVEIIKSLPKSGSIQPSNATKLKFYSFFKQATEGPCELPKPGFWEIVNRAKWDAWNKLGDMSKEDAMKRYVAEFIQILQTHTVDDLDDPSVLKDYVSLMGPYIEYAPPEVREMCGFSNGKGNLNNNDVTLRGENHHVSNSSNEVMKPPAMNGHNSVNNDSDSDEFSDTLERVDEGCPSNPEECARCPDTLGNHDEQVAEPLCEGPGVLSVRGGGDHRSAKGSTSASGGHGTQRDGRQGGSSRGPNLPTSFPRDPQAATSGGGGGGNSGGPGGAPGAEEELGLAAAVIRLQHVLEQVVQRLDSLEALLSERRSQSRPSFLSTPRMALLLLLAWPLLLQWIVFLMRRRRRLHR